MRLKIAVHPFDALRVIRFKDSHNVRVAEGHDVFASHHAAFDIIDGKARGGQLRIRGVNHGKRNAVFLQIEIVADVGRLRPRFL